MQELVDKAIEIAFKGAFEYLECHKLKADISTLSQVVKQWVKIKWPEAMADAKLALDANMTQVAETLFAAMMVQAGIEAAKECGLPSEIGEDGDRVLVEISPELINKMAEAKHVRTEVS